MKASFKKSIGILLSLLMALSVFGAPAFSSIAAAGATQTVTGLVSDMSTEEKVAQMLMPALRYYNGEGVTELSEKAKFILEKRGFSGVILFAQNNVSTEQTVRLIDEMQTANANGSNRTQLLISVDQEGAGVTRLASGTQGPGNMALAATGNSQNAYDIGAIIGQELNVIGYNVDFAPVVDVNSNPSNPVIGVRSFSDDAATVADFASAFMKGLQSESIITALKHFPGHGDAATDSHTGLPRIEKTYEALKANELVPFERCIADAADMIMTAHIQFPLIETDTYVSIKDGSTIELPATLSKTIISDILRRDLGFNGVVVTDAMNMAAIAEHFEALDTAKLAINAGVDIILMPVDTGTDAGIDALDQYIADVASMVDAGEIPMENVDNAVTRILTLKEQHGLLSSYAGIDLAAAQASAESIVGAEDHHETEWRIAKKSVTMVKNDGDMLPIKNNGKTVILVPYANEVNSGEYAVDLLKRGGLIPSEMDISVFLTSGKTADQMKEAVEGAVNVIAIAEQYSQAGLAAAQYSNLDAVADYVHKNGGKIAFVSCYLPYDAARLQKGDAILLAYSSKGMNEKPDFSAGSVPTYGVSIPVGIYTAFDPDAQLGALPVNIPRIDGSYKYSSEYLYDRGFGLQYSGGLAEAKQQLRDAIDAAKAFFATIEDNEKYAEIADELNFAIGRGEAALASDDAEEVLSFALNVLFAIENAQAAKTDADAEADRPDDTAPNLCKFCGKDHSGNLWQKFVGFLHKIFYFFAHLFGKM